MGPLAPDVIHANKERSRICVLVAVLVLLEGCAALGPLEKDRFLERWYGFNKSEHPLVSHRARARLVRRLRADDEFFDFVSGEFFLEVPSSHRKYDLLEFLWEARGGDSCRDHVIYLLEQPDRRLRAFGVLRCLGGAVPNISGHLIRAFRETSSDSLDDAQIRYLALDALCRIIGRDAQPYMVEALSDRSRHVRHHAMLNIGGLRLIATLPHVLSALRELDPEDYDDVPVISAALYALPRLTGRSCPPRVRTLKQMRNWWLEQISLEADREQDSPRQR